MQISNKYYPSQGSFLDPQSSKERIERFKELVKERYLISKNINTSYNDVGKITPLEREYLIEFLVDEAKKSKELIEKNKNQNKTR